MYFTRHKASPASSKSQMISYRYCIWYASQRNPEHLPGLTSQNGQICCAQQCTCPKCFTASKIAHSGKIFICEVLKMFFPASTNRASSVFKLCMRAAKRLSSSYKTHPFDIEWLSAPVNDLHCCLSEQSTFHREDKNRCRPGFYALGRWGPLWDQIPTEVQGSFPFRRGWRVKFYLRFNPSWESGYVAYKRNINSYSHANVFT